VGALGLYARYARASIKGQMQYPASFVFLTLGQFLSTIVEFIGIAALFSRFQNLGGWTLAQVALFYGPDGAYSDKAKSLLSHIPLGRPGRPEEIAHAVLFLVAPEASYVNGAVLEVSGGMSV